MNCGRSMFSFVHLKQSADETSKNFLAESTTRRYQEAREQYEVVFSLIEGAPNPYPPSAEKMLCFLQYKKQMGCSFSTLQTLFHCLSSTFKQNYNCDMSNCKEIKQYFQAINREMLWGSSPFAVDAILKEDLEKISHKINKFNIIDIRDFSCFTLQF